MARHRLSSISPIDGRYGKQTEALSQWFSELALIRYRCQVELAYFQFLCEIPLPELKHVDAKKLDALRKRASELTEDEASQVKHIEQRTNHDVKAVEYLLKEWLEEVDLSKEKEFVHFALTSQDINNTALPMAVKDFVLTSYLPAVAALVEQLKSKAAIWKDIPMLARTHGQAASPTRLGKEIMVFVERLEHQQKQISPMRFSAKFGGATGNFNAHAVAYPNMDWPLLADRFVKEKLGLVRQRFTTQIEHYDDLAALFDAMRRINIILIDLCRDLWTYVSQDYFKQRIKENEVGSSAMPHKVNPIDLENAEGNLGLANALFGHLSEKLPISRLQRDLTDSTVTRNIGVPMAHTHIAMLSLAKGLGKLDVNETAIMRDLEANWAVVAEGIQTILRRAGVEQPYEKLKALTRGKEQITKEDMQQFIDTLEVPEELKKQLRALSPSNYTGVNLMG